MSINNANTEPWKKLGYPSEQAYLNAMGSGNTLFNYSTTSPFTQHGGSFIKSPLSFKTPYFLQQAIDFANEYRGETGDEKSDLETVSTSTPPLSESKPKEVMDGKNPVESSKEWWNNFYDVQRNMILSNYGGAQNILDEEKKSSQQAASITYDKLKKYLPMQIKAQGLSGLGVSESTMLQAQNNYANQMSDIGSAYSANTADLEAQKTNALGELENYRAAKLDGIQEETEAEAREAQDEAVSFITTNFETNEDWAGGLSYLEENKDSFVNEKLYNALYNAYSSKHTAQQESEKQTQEEEKQAETDARITAGDKYIEYNGKEYKLAEKLGRQANEIRKNDDFTKQLNALGYTDPYDENIPNGTTFYIRRDWSGSNNVSFWDFIPIANVASITGAGNGWHVTYYNGEWYHSAEQ